MLRVTVFSSGLGRKVSGVQDVRKAAYSLAYALEQEKVETVKSYREIPGPKSRPLVGNNVKFLPYIGEYGKLPLFGQLRLMRDTYGDIVKLEGVFNRRPTVFLFNPEHIETAYRHQGIWPKRVAMETVGLYRDKRDSIYNGEHGLTTSQGKQWADFRSKVNQHLMQPRAIKPHLQEINSVTEEFLGRVRDMRDPLTLEVPPIFNNEINKWALESICSIALNQRPGCLKPNLEADSEPQTIINSVHSMFELLLKLELYPSFWRVYETRNLKRLFRVLDSLNWTIITFINRAKKKLDEEPSQVSTKDRSVLEKLLGIDERVARTMALDMITAGVDTTGNASGALLYFLATNQDKQDKLREEAFRILPEQQSPITYETLLNAPYAKACVKEILRRFPLTTGTLRTMQKDVVIGGYVVPEGWDVIQCHGILAQDSRQFPSAYSFIPERWLRKGSGEFPPASTAHPFAYMPFGFGSRACIGKRFAECEMEILVLKMVRNFKLEWHHGPLEYNSHFINIVSTPLQLKFLDL